MENSWITIDHVKRSKDQTIMTCHINNNKYYKVYRIMYCGMQSEDGIAHTVLWENLNVVMAENGMPNVDLKGFMACHPIVIAIPINSTRSTTTFFVQTLGPKGHAFEESLSATYHNVAHMTSMFGD